MSRCAKRKWLRSKMLEIDYPELHWTYGLWKGMVTALNGCEARAGEKAGLRELGEREKVLGDGSCQWPVGDELDPCRIASS